MRMMILLVPVLCCSLTSALVQAEPQARVQRTGKAKVLTLAGKVISAPYRKLKPLGSTGKFIGKSRLGNKHLVQPSGKAGPGYGGIKYLPVAKAFIGKCDIPRSSYLDRRRSGWAVMDSETGKANWEGYFRRIKRTSHGRLIGVNKAYANNSMQFKGQVLLDRKGVPLHQGTYKKILEGSDGALSAIKFGGVKVMLFADGTEGPTILKESRSLRRRRLDLF